MSYFFSRFLRLLLIIMLLGLSFVLAFDHLAHYLLSKTLKKLDVGNITFTIDRFTPSNIVFKDIELTDSTGTTLGIGQLAFQYQFRDLLQKQIYIPTLSIKQCRLTIQKQNNTWQLDGTTDALTRIKHTETESQPASGFKIDIARIHIIDSQLIYILPENQSVTLPLQLEIAFTEDALTGDGILNFMGRQNHFSARYDRNIRKSNISFTSAPYAFAEVQSFFPLPEDVFLKGVMHSDARLSVALQPFRLEEFEWQVAADQAAVQFGTVNLTQLPWQKHQNNDLLVKAKYHNDQLELQLCPLRLTSQVKGTLSELALTVQKPLMPPPYEGTVLFALLPDGDKNAPFSLETSQQMAYSFHPVQANDWKFNLHTDEKSAPRHGITMSFADAEIELDAAFKFDAVQDSSGLSSQLSSKFALEMKTAACQSSSSNCIKLSAPQLEMDAQLGLNDAAPGSLNGVLELVSDDIAVDMFKHPQQLEDQHHLSIGTLAVKLPFSDAAEQPVAASDSTIGSLFAGNINLDQYQLGDLSGTLMQWEREVKFEGVHQNQLLEGMPVHVNATMKMIPANEFDLDFTAHAPEFSQLLVLGQYAPELKGYLLEGKTSLDLHAQLHSHILVGPSLFVSLKNGTLTNTKKKFSLKNINTTLELPNLSNLYSYKTQLTFDELTFNQLNLSNGRVVYNLDHPQTLYIDKIAADWASGRIESQAFSMPQFHLPEAITFYCSRLSLQQVFHQFGIENFGGEGTVSGNIPIHLGTDMMNFDNAFLYSTPGIGGTLRLYDSNFLLQGVPPGTVQFHQMDFASEALRNFQYNWVKLSLNSTGDDAELKMLVEGEPEHPIPFEYNKEIGAFTRMKVQSKGGIKHPILLETNFHLPLGQMLRYGKSINKILN